MEIYPLIYKILDASSEACQEMTSIKTDCIHTQIGIAYAHYLTKNSETALRLIAHISPLIDSDHFEWLFEYSKKEFNAVVIYSLLLKSVLEIENYYLDMLNVYPNEKDFFIYHNLATRLFFQGHANEALDYIEIALENDSKQAEAYVIKGLCYQKLEKNDESEIAFKEAAELEPAIFPLSRMDYTQQSLLLLLNYVA